MVDLLLSICMEHKRHDKAVELVERARRTFCESEHPFAWVVKEGICHLHLGNLEKAKVCFVTYYMLMEVSLFVSRSVTPFVTEYLLFTL